MILVNLDYNNRNSLNERKGAYIFGREYELADLEQAYTKESFAFYVVYGRRRIGKTTLLREFSKQKNVLYFAAQETNTILNLEKFSREIYKLQHLPESMPSFSSWEAFDLSIIDKLKTRARLFPGYKEYYFTFFGKGGFSDAVLQEAKKDKHILLFTLEDIFRKS